MKYCLYGNDIDDTTSPLEAGLQWTVKFDKGDFIGRDFMLKQQQEGLKRHLIAFVVEGKGVPRHGYKVFSGNEEIGVVTSGTMSPSMKVPLRHRICEAAVQPDRFDDRDRSYGTSPHGGEGCGCANPEKGALI